MSALPLLNSSTSGLAYLQRDVHTFYQPGQAKMVHLDWNIQVHFSKRVLGCVATITFDGDGDVVLDTRDLDVKSVTTDAGERIDHQIGETVSFFGAPLAFTIPAGVRTVVIRYRTSRESSGLLWQTGSEKFLFSQGQTLHARSYVPCQDSSGIRFTFEALIRVPRELRGLIAAPDYLGRTVNGKYAVERWRMPHAVPAYLLAIAVGNIAERKLDKWIFVYAVPSMIDASAHEFEDLPKILKKAEKLFGPYRWGRYAVLVMPPSFPYGGMENPTMTFVTPALVVGDKSGVSTLIHELAHSWTGNLATNATPRDFWLNEGWTVWAENRIIEAVSGRGAALLNIRLMQLEYERDVRDRFADSHPLMTALAPDMTGKDPDEVFNRGPYSKGSRLLIRIEQHVGRRRFDRFVRKYIKAFAFKSITTAQFLEFLAKELPGVIEALRVWEWVYEAGIPANAPKLTSRRIERIERLARSGKVLPGNDTWITKEVLLFLELLPRPLGHEQLQVIDEQFGLSRSANPDLRWAYLLLAVESGDERVLEALEEFLLGQGRKKYLEPLYRAVSRKPKGRAWARRVFKKARSRYHPAARENVQRILAAA